MKSLTRAAALLCAALIGADAQATVTPGEPPVETLFGGYCADYPQPEKIEDLSRYDLRGGVAEFA